MAKGPSTEPDAQRRRARVTHFFALALLSLPILVALLAPVAAAAGREEIALACRAAFHKVCHQMPERSFFLFGAPLAICSRCTGVYAGLLVGAAFAPVCGRLERLLARRRSLLLALILPGVLHPLAGKLGFTFDAPLLRAATALLASAPVGLLLVPALAEAFSISSRPVQGEPNAET